MLMFAANKKPKNNQMQLLSRLTNYLQNGVKLDD